MQPDYDELASRIDAHPGNGLAMSQKSQLSQSQPVPLVRPVAPPQPYPIDALGTILGPAARAVMEHIQVPDALAAHAVLGFAALAAQAHANVQTLGGLRPISLYMMAVAESGERKSAADRLAGSAVHERKLMLAVTYKAALREWEAAREGHKMRVRQAKENAESADDLARTLIELQESPPPRKPWFVVSEPTPEGLFLSLKDGQLSQALATDEGGQFVGGHAMSEEAELRTITLLSKLWDGSPVDRVRATDKEHVTLFGRRLAVHLMAQPEVATRMLGKSLYKSQGMLARFLICQPASRIGSRVNDGSAKEPRDDPRLRRYWHALRQLLERLPTEDHDVGGLDPPCLALSPEARVLLVESYNSIETAQQDTGELVTVREFASKAAEHACRLAAVLTLMEKPDAIAVDLTTMRWALELTQFYIQEHVRLAGAAGVSIEIGNAVMVEEWLRRTKRTEVTAREIMRLGPYAILEAPAAKGALRTLLEHGRLCTEDGSGFTVPAALLDEWRA